jgi:hypothetical protein
MAVPRANGGPPTPPRLSCQGSAAPQFRGCSAGVKIAAPPSIRDVVLSKERAVAAMNRYKSSPSIPSTSSQPCP